MKSSKSSLKLLALGFLVSSVFTGCKSTDGDDEAGGSVYYGTGISDPWYYGDYYHDADIIVTPPVRPMEPPGPSHPIATPPPAAPRPTPMPSIPSSPRASFRR